MNQPLITIQDIETILQPETDLERFFIGLPHIQEGLLWGEPRYGHPEGKVLYHIVEIYKNIDCIIPPLSIKDRDTLRLITLLHDTFKYAEDKSYPRDWSKHHGILARLYAKPYISVKSTLDIIELHDEAYYCWRLEVLEDAKDKAQLRLAQLLERLKGRLQLFYIFFKCDTATGDKTQAPVKWFEKKIEGIERISFQKI
jgi:HD domain